MRHWNSGEVWNQRRNELAHFEYAEDDLCSSLRLRIQHSVGIVKPCTNDRTSNHVGVLSSDGCSNMPQCTEMIKTCTTDFIHVFVHRDVVVE